LAFQKDILHSPLRKLKRPRRNSVYIARDDEQLIL
jgi:hypothetical protein